MEWRRENERMEWHRENDERKSSTLEAKETHVFLGRVVASEWNWISALSLSCIYINS